MIVQRSLARDTERPESRGHKNKPCHYCVGVHCPNLFEKRVIFRTNVAKELVHIERLDGPLALIVGREFFMMSVVKAGRGTKTATSHLSIILATFSTNILLKHG